MTCAWRIGVISDTHGVLRESALRALKNVDHIIHCGDIGRCEILSALSEIAPVTAVRGNIDKESWAESLPKTEAAVFGDSYLYVIHDLKELDLDPWVAGCRAVVSGHTHEPKSEVRDGVLFLNPGSAGPKRFDLPTTVAIVTLDPITIHAEIVELAA